MKHEYHVTLDVHLHDARDSAILLEIRTALAALLRQGHTIMGKVEDLRTELAAANTVTNEIAADVAELVQKVTSGETLTDADIAAAQELTSRLRAVAAAYTADPTTPPV